MIHLGSCLPESCYVCHALSAFATGASDLTTCDKFFKGVVPCHNEYKKLYFKIIITVLNIAVIVFVARDIEKIAEKEAEHL